MTTATRQIAGEALAVTDVAGGEPTLVFIHGNSLSTRAWQHQLDAEELAAYRRVAFDLPGHGDSPPSPRPDERYTLPGYAACVTELVRTLDLGALVLVGHSLGGHIALEAAADVPQLAGVFITGTPPLATAADMQQAFRPVPELAHAFNGELSPDAAMAWACAMTTGEAPDWMLANMRATDPRARASIGASAAAGEFRDEVEAIRAADFPVAVVHGADDALIATDYLQSLEVPMWRDGVQLVSGGNHAWPSELPDEFNQRLLAFVRDVAG